jgi:hypothetical protein
VIGDARNQALQLETEARKSRNTCNTVRCMEP